MALNIKNEETLRLVGKLAEQTGQRPTEAITEAVRSRLETLARERESVSVEERIRRVDAMLERIWARQTPEEREEAKRFMEGMYDENGLPTW